MVAPTNPGFGVPDLFPNHTPTVHSGVTAKHQASRLPLEVPVFQATSRFPAPGNRRVRIVIPNGQITEIPSEITFVPDAANVWPATISCYDDGTGHSIYVYYDDGVVTSS